MNPNLLMTILLLPLWCCEPISSKPDEGVSSPDPSNSQRKQEVRTIGDIPIPTGYKRVSAAPGSFGEWLQKIPVKADKRVFLYDGTLKSNQSAQYLVLDIPVGQKDLQQCADAIMRMRAQYLLDMGKEREILFVDNNGKKYAYSDFPGRRFENYLETVFAFCGTISLSRQLSPTATIHAMVPGDVLIRGGSPGHAVIVIDMAVNDRGNKIFMLAQSYMPAQNIHVLKNPNAEDGGPWYQVHDKRLIYTPEWTFQALELKKW